MTPATTRGSDEGVRARTLADLVRVSAGKLVSLGSLLLCNVLVARESPDAAEYGRFAAGLSLALILDAVVGTPLDLSTVRFAALHPRTTERTDRFQGAAFRAKVVLGLILLAVAVLSGSRLAATVLGPGAGAGLLAVTFLCTLMLLLVRSTAVHLQLQGRFNRYAALDAAQGALRLLAVLCPVLLGVRSAEAFLGAYAAGTGLAFGAGLLLFAQKYLRSGWPERADLREGAVHVGFMGGIVILGTITGRADVPILAASSAADAGQYAVALQLASVLTLLAGYASVVMQPRVVDSARSGRFAALVGWNVLGAGAISLVALAAARRYAGLLIPALFGAKYDGAAGFVVVLLIGTCADLFFMPVLMMFAIQTVPAVSLGGELAITLGFFGAVFAGAADAGIAMAWVVSGVRVAKLLLYSGLALVYVRRWRRSPGRVGRAALAPSLPE